MGNFGDDVRRGLERQQNQLGDVGDALGRGVAPGTGFGRALARTSANVAITIAAINTAATPAAHCIR